MEYAKPSTAPRQKEFISGTGTGAADVAIEAGTRLPRKQSLRTNFSYPRVSRHELSECRSSNGSLPGMTDASDSDLSFDDDCIYNASAGQLWDKFWPNGTSSSYRQSQDDPIPLHPMKREDYLKVESTRRRRLGTDDDAVRVSTRENGLQVEGLTTPGHALESSPFQRTPKKTAVTYSVYPKLPVIDMQRHAHPPRTSSLSFEPPSPPRRSLFVKGTKSGAGLKSSKSTHNINSLFITPPLPSHSTTSSSRQPSSTTAGTAASVPVSPAYPPPPTPKTLRPSTSAFNLRDKTRASNNNNDDNNKNGLVSHNKTAPLALLFPSALPESLPTRPQVERFVSVFELDSDSETEADAAADEGGNSFAKRIARGLHKKSASEKRGGGGAAAAAEHKAVAAGLAALDGEGSERDADEKARDSDSLGRKRGGSLGRIFGLMGR